MSNSTVTLKNSSSYLSQISNPDIDNKVRANIAIGTGHEQKKLNEYNKTSARFRIPIRRTGPRTGTIRNDPCPCGSGRKYKKCCM